MICSCEHKKGSHYYVPLVGDNTGRCLVQHCDCNIYNESHIEEETEDD